MSLPEKAVEAAHQEILAYMRDACVPDARCVLEAAYPIIRAEVIAEVVRRLDRVYDTGSEWDPARLVEREFS